MSELRAAGASLYRLPGNSVICIFFLTDGKKVVGTGEDVATAIAEAMKEAFGKTEVHIDPMAFAGVNIKVEELPLFPDVGADA